MLLTMEEIKAQLRLDEDFDADDRHLQLLACAAQKRTETYLNRKLYAPDETIPDSDPDGLHLPDDIRLGMLMLISHFYENRSSVTEVEKLDMPQTVGNNLCTVIGMTNQQRCSAVLCSIRRLVIHFRIKQRNQRIRRNGVKAYRHRCSPFYSRAGYHPLLHGAASSCSRQHFALRRAKGRRGQGQELTAL